MGKSRSLTFFGGLQKLHPKGCVPTTLKSRLVNYLHIYMELFQNKIFLTINNILLRFCGSTEYLKNSFEPYQNTLLELKLQCCLQVGPNHLNISLYFFPFSLGF